MNPSSGHVEVVVNGASDLAVENATGVHNLVIGRLAPDNAQILGAYTLRLHIVPSDTKLTDLPPYAFLKGSQTFEHTRSWDNVRGAGGLLSGTVIDFAVAEEELTRDNTIVPGDTQQYFPWFGEDFLQIHETAHIVHDFGLTPDQRETVQRLYDERNANPATRWLAPTSYTSANTDEYFANSVAAYFGAPHSSASVAEYSKEWLRAHDSGMFALLEDLFPEPKSVLWYALEDPPPSRIASETLVPVAAGGQRGRRRPPPAPPPNRARWWLLIAGALVVLLIAGGTAALLATGGGDDSGTGKASSASKRDVTADDATDSGGGGASASCVLSTALRLAGIDKVPGEYHQGNIEVEVRDASGPVEGATVSIRTEKSDSTSTTASGASAADGVVVFGMRTTRFGTNRLVVTGVDQPGCRYDADASQTSITWEAAP